MKRKTHQQIGYDPIRNENQMHFRRNINEDEHIDDTNYGTKTVALFLANNFGVRLVHRGENDTHIIVEILCEDDEHWFVDKSGSSSYWLSELIELLQYVEKWIKENSLDDNGYGYKDNE